MDDKISAIPVETDMQRKSILDGVDAIFCESLLPEGVRRCGKCPPYFQNQSTLRAVIKEGKGRICVTKHLFTKALERIIANFGNGKPSRSKWLWQLRREEGFTQTNPSLEKTLEKQTIRHLDKTRWFNQLTTASGLVCSEEKHRAVDLVEKLPEEAFRFIELKIASNTPLAAAVEILEYGLLFAFAREHRDEIFGAEDVPVLNAAKLELRVLAPAPYYDRHDKDRTLGWLEAQFCKGFGEFAKDFGFEANFQFTCFPQSFIWDPIAASKDENLGKHLQAAYSAVTPVYGKRTSRPTVGSGARLAGSTDGIFYIIALLGEWSIMSVSFDQQTEFGHTDFWEQSVVDHLVTQWHSKVINTFPTPAELRATLLPLVYAFPRGRVVRQEDQFTVYHGNNLKPFMKLSRRSIEGKFGIQGRAAWVFDEHEQCVAHDRDQIREVLGLKQTWPAAAVSW